MPPRLYAVFAGMLGIALGVALLALWLSGDPGLIEFAAWRCKTNTCVGLVLCGAALVACASARPRLRRLGVACAVAAAAIGVLTLLQYAAGVDLGIDELVARDWPSAESA